MLLMGTVAATAALISPELCEQGNPALESGGVRINDPVTKTYYRADFPGAGLQVSEPVPADFWIKITMNADKSFDFESNYYMDLVVVKGGPQANCYNYYDYESESFYPVSADTGLFSPANASGDPAGVSHIDFYFDGPVVREDLAVTKTAVTSYTRTHEWDINKRVETEKGDTVDEGMTPKIWLYEGVEEAECATWYVDVTYEGYEDGDFSVEGTVTIDNIGDTDATITGVEDLLGGDEIPADVDFGVTFPYILPAGEKLEGTYSEPVDSKIDGFNVVTVTTAMEVYNADAAIIWGDPDDEEFDEINVEDLSDLFGLKDLGTLYAADYAVGEGETFEYSQCFAWADYGEPGSHTYDNTATIVETEQSASARLKVNVLHEDLDVSKTAVTSFDRTHKWDIDKKVETDNGQMKDGLPKIWLWNDGSGDEWATWYVDVTYEGYDDSDFKVCGDVTIENTGTQDAWITSIEDLLGGTEITVDFGEDFELPYLLEVGDTLEGTYCEDGYAEGKNEVTVTTEVDTYFADADIVWGDPDNEYLDEINVIDESDLFDEIALGMVTAPNDAQFTYDKFFAWADYDAPGPYIYDNTATIVETEQSASATLKVNWDTYCWDDDTAWAYGAPYAKANWDFTGSANWGWTNGPIGEGSYQWPIYAGAGGNDISKGTIVGTLYVDYVGGVVTVKYQLFAGNALGEVHLWVGKEPLPSTKRGKQTIYTDSPGLFPYKSGSFGFDKYDPSTWVSEWTWSGTAKGNIYVSAHAVVWQQVQCPNVIE